MISCREQTGSYAVPRVILFVFMLILAVEPVAAADVAPPAYPALDIYLVTDEAPTSDGRESQATLRLKSIMAIVMEDYLAGSLLLAPEVRQLFRQRFP